VGALLAGAVVPGIFNLFRGTARSNNDVVAIEDIESAAGWILADGLMALTVTDGSGGAFPDGVETVCQVDVPCMQLDWTDFSGWGTDANGDPTPHTSIYTLLTGNRLQRTYDGVSHTIGRNITDIRFTYDVSTRVITMRITSAPQVIPAQSETRTFLMHLRPAVQL
ncbi:MAG: hypothetical protein ACE5IG_05665, partial [Dehalococcoidia bacterium]